MKLYDSELYVMGHLWKAGDCTAKELAAAMAEQVGWSKTTTYTVIKKCIDKKAMERIDPGFLCHPLVTREEAQKYETDVLIKKFYDGSADQLVASLLQQRPLTKEEATRIMALLEKWK